MSASVLTRGSVSPSLPHKGRAFPCGLTLAPWWAHLQGSVSPSLSLKGRAFPTCKDREAVRRSSKDRGAVRAFPTPRNKEEVETAKKANSGQEGQCQPPPCPPKSRRAFVTAAAVCKHRLQAPPATPKARTVRPVCKPPSASTACHAGGKRGTGACLARNSPPASRAAPQWTGRTGASHNGRGALWTGRISASTVTHNGRGEMVRPRGPGAWCVRSPAS